MSGTIEMPEREMPERAPGSGEPPGSERASRRGAGAARLAMALAAVLVIVIAVVATSPFWAASIAELLPWGRPPGTLDKAAAARLAGLARETAAMRADLARLLAAQRAETQGRDSDEQTLAGIKRGFAKLESQVAGLAAHPPAAAAGLAKLEKDLAAQRAAEASALANLQQELAAHPPSDAAAITRLQQQLAALPAGDPAAMAKLEQQVSGLEARVGDVAQAVSTLAARPAVPAAAAAQQNKATLLLSLMQLREAVESSQPFPAQYQAFVAAAAGHKTLLQSVHPLAALARDGVPSRTALTRQFRGVAAKLQAAPAPAPSGGWSAGVLGQLRGLVSVRRLGAPSQNPVDAAVERARAALARGNLAGALAAVRTLPAADQQPARGWVAAVQRRIAAEAALTAAEERLSAPAQTATGAKGTNPPVTAPPARPGSHS